MENSGNLNRNPYSVERTYRYYGIKIQLAEIHQALDIIMKYGGFKEMLEAKQILNGKLYKMFKY